MEDPNHPVTQTLLYIYSMESPVRYALLDATKARDDSQLINLGALAYALKVIVATAGANRGDLEAWDSKLWCCVGMPMIEQQISDLKELEPTKKQPAAPALNWSGFTACFDSKRASDDAWRHPAKETTPCVLSIELASDHHANFFRLNTPAYTPYH